MSSYATAQFLSGTLATLPAVSVQLYRIPELPIEGPCSLVDRIGELTLNPLGFSPLWFEPRFRFLTAVVRASLGSHLGKHKFCLRIIRWFFSGVRLPLMNDRLDISEIFLKGP